MHVKCFKSRTTSILRELTNFLKILLLALNYFIILFVFFSKVHILTTNLIVHALF